MNQTGESHRLTRLCHSQSCPDPRSAPGSLLSSLLSPSLSHFFVSSRLSVLGLTRVFAGIGSTTNCPGRSRDGPQPENLQIIFMKGFFMFSFAIK